MNGPRLNGLVEWVWRVIVVALLPVLGWIVVGQQRIAEDITEIRIELERRPLREEVPPTWFLEQFGDLKADVAEIRAELRVRDNSQ
ncbi:MAG: hypothetical protein ACYSVY_24770 [Planctomycetota bacterium]|jgi:hypothetical protein